MYAQIRKRRSVAHKSNIKNPSLPTLDSRSLELRSLERKRCAHYQLEAAHRVVTAADATRYINRYSFCWLFAPRDRKLELPSLFEAVKGRRDAHIEDWDKDSDRVWTWKNDLPAARRVYYGKALAG